LFAHIFWLIKLQNQVYRGRTSARSPRNDLKTQKPRPTAGYLYPALGRGFLHPRFHLNYSKWNILFFAVKNLGLTASRAHARELRLVAATIAFWQYLIIF